MRSSALAPLLAGLLGVCSWTPRLAAADVPVCSGTATAKTRAALEQGKAHYRRGRADASVAADEMRAAVASFDSACAGGDTTALEFRAYALFALGRYVDAAESLDAFLADHTLESLPRDVHDRVSAQRPAILAKVATVSVSSDAATAEVVVGGRSVGPAPAQARVLAHTPVEIEVKAPGFLPMKRTVTLEAGAQDTEAFTLQPMLGAQLRIDAPDGAEVSIDGAPVGRTPLGPIQHAPGEVDVTVTLGGEPHVHHAILALGDDRTETFTFAAPAKPVEVAAAPPGEHRLTKWVYASAGASLAMVAGGVGFAVWRNNRTSTYDASCLGAQVPGCSATLDQFHVAAGAEVAAFALGGALAATAVVLWVLDRKPHAPPAPVSFVCAPGVGALGCGGTF